MKLFYIRGEGPWPEQVTGPRMVALRLWLLFPILSSTYMIHTYIHTYKHLIARTALKRQPRTVAGWLAIATVTYRLHDVMRLSGWRHRRRKTSTRGQAPIRRLKPTSWYSNSSERPHRMRCPLANNVEHINRGSPPQVSLLVGIRFPV